ncbi:MAG: YraN family protein [Candidatus Paceibacterota bacterium]|jgi:putative endonuclease
MGNITIAEPADRRTQKRILGDLGEKTACKFLVKRGYEIVERNYLRKCGEIDIVTKKKDTIHFVEVKTVSCERLKEGRADVTHETKPQNMAQNDSYRPEDNIHPWKLKRLSRTIQSYLAEKRIAESQKWQFDAITVLLNVKDKLAKIDFLENLIL